MNFLTKTLKYLLILLLLLILLAALTVLSWYEGWPMFTGAAVLGGIAALYITGRGLLALWRWRNKRAFVSKMMSEQRTAEVPEEVNAAVKNAWEQGMACVLGSPSRFSRRLRSSQPWFLVLEDGERESSPFDSFGRRLPEGSSPLYWHFLPSCVVLRLRGSVGDGGKTWESELEEFLGARRRSAPLRGIVLKLRFSAIEEMSESELGDLGQRLRTRVNQIMLTANAMYPVYILIEEIESLPGMSALLTQYLPETEGLLGGWAESWPGKWAAESAAARLEELILDGAAEGTPPHGDMLAALGRLKAAAPKLDILADAISRELSHQVNPEIVGIYFCSSCPVGRGPRRRPAFVGEFISRILPAAPLPQPFSGIPVGAGGKMALMAGWLLLTFSVCGLLAANTIYQYRILSQDPHFAESHKKLMGLDNMRGTLPADYSKLYSEMNYILELESAHSSWYLPKMGEDMLGRALTGVRHKYVRDVNRQILRPMIDQFRDILASPATEKTRGQNMDLAVELSWLTSALSDRIEEAHGIAVLERDEDDVSETFPLTELNGGEWTPVTGQLIVNALRWIESEEELALLSTEIKSLLVQSFTRRGSNLLEDLRAQLNSSHSAENVRLSQFWPHIPIQSEEDVQVEYCYTTAGMEELNDSMKNIEKIAGTSDVLKMYFDNFRADYLLDYAQAWEKFARSFTASGPSLRYGNLVTYPGYERITKVTDLPHVKVYQKIMTETAPLRDSKIKPSWVSSMGQVDAVVNYAIISQEKNKKPNLMEMFSAMETNPNLMNQLRTGVKSQTKVSDLVKASDSMRSFFANCSSLLGVFSNPNSALLLCTAKYGRAKGAEPPKGLPYGAALNDFKAAFSLIDEEWSPAREVLGGILDFIAAEATIETAKVLQLRWEDEVVNAPAVRSGSGGGDAIFGEKGLVPAFVQENLGALLSYSGGVLEPSTWEGMPFPFDEKFLDALVQGETAASQLLPPQQRESYGVTVSSRPPLVNPEVKARPNMMTLTLEGEDGPQQLLNQNFPKEASFTYSPKKSGKTVLVISFADFELRREYHGFKEFVQDFRTGEKTFYPKDFPNAAPLMVTSGIKTVKVPILVSNTEGIFTDPKVETRNFPSLPHNITRLVTN
ncbi:type VI secretion protein IcmF/TssM N-terminal domain-containing protein [Cloacibacillus sp.]|uniref:type VI secretion protein IcmF/TssM N-terminal domain-containing protein n=1 Tax=Cloacibacillus sp. TaxID=2049023 RepID=UPI0025BD27E1|nr:type VI secretion protein IcmF/TssM N-terminal domain-containing protein [Cloacibacillus sp.]MCC8058677.1 type VI secretion system protein [Cloacibacillus sp.]